MSLARPLSLAALSLLLLATACGDGHTGDPATTEFAPELGVDLSAMQKRASGLYVLDRTVGSGVEATTARIPSVRYTLWLSDGTKVDSNEGRQAFEFLLGGGQVIAGWEEGIVGMKVGGQRRLVVPSSLGYGDKGGGPVPGKAVLVFDVALLGVR
jgi:peptidylprolyl isomerase